MFLHENPAPFRSGRCPLAVLLGFFLFFGAGASAFGAPSVEEMAGQMLLVGFKGQEPEACGAILEDIRVRHLGGVILFKRDAHNPLIGRNIRDAAQVKRLTSALREAAPADRPLFVAVDQEGGKVARFLPRDGFPAFPSAAELGRGTPEATRNTAFRMGTLLRDLGVNLNFAPVLDVNAYPDSPAIGRLGRSFSADPKAVSAHGAAFADGLNAAGVVAVFKHFPGHGSAHTDSHKGVTDITATWSPKELEAYAKPLASSGPHMVMTGHLFHRGLDPDAPATLSPKVVNGLLRGRGYDGVVVTDDLQMQAIAARYSLEEVVLRAIDAGVDILLIGNNLEYDPAAVARVEAVIVRAVAEGRLSRARLEASWARIMKLKGALREPEGKERHASGGRGA